MGQQQQHRQRQHCSHQRPARRPQGRTVQKQITLPLICWPFSRCVQGAAWALGGCAQGCRWAAGGCFGMPIKWQHVAEYQALSQASSLPHGHRPPTPTNRCRSCSGRSCGAAPDGAAASAAASRSCWPATQTKPRSLPWSTHWKKACPLPSSPAVSSLACLRTAGSCAAAAAVAAATPVAAAAIVWVVTRC